MKMTSDLLAVNPDVYTLWNCRREIILKRRQFAVETVPEDTTCREVKMEELFEDVMSEKTNVKTPRESFDEKCQEELYLTEVCLNKNPKSYSAWHHRSWTISIMFNPDIQRELLLCKSALLKDERNFHCWDYKRFIFRHANLDIKDEMEFTLEKIQENFSNFSSWFYRSTLFTDAASQGIIDFKDVYDTEYNRVEHAFFTDPTDQSSWFFHRWLVSTDLGQKLPFGASKNLNTSVRITRIITDVSKFMQVIVFNQSLAVIPEVIVTLCLDDQQSIHNEPFHPVSEHSCVWYQLIPRMKQLKKIIISINNTCHEIELDPNHEIIICEESCLNENRLRVNLKPENIENLKTLHDMEPENKWINLAMSQSVPGMHQESVFNRLTVLDPLRDNYYRDQRSKHFLLQESKDWKRCVMNDHLMEKCLTSIYFLEQMIHLRYLNLSGNLLTRIRKSFNQLVCLETLILDHNRITLADKSFQMVLLKIISVQNNCEY